MDPFTITVVALMPYFSSMNPRSNGRMHGMETSVTVCRTVAVESPLSITEESFVPTSDDFFRDFAASSDWLDLAQAVFGDSRSMTTEERQAFEDFTWAELRA